MIFFIWIGSRDKAKIRPSIVTPLNNDAKKLIIAPSYNNSKENKSSLSLLMDLQQECDNLKKEIVKLEVINTFLNEKLSNYKGGDDEKSKEIELIKSILKTRSSKFPPLARALATYEEAKMLSVADYLDHKIHPAARSAEIVRKTVKDARLFIEKFYAAKNLITSYEELFPWLEEYREFDLETFEKDIEDKQKNDDYKNDPVSRYISEFDYLNLSETERNQLALDRYIQSHKSNIQIGRMYERYIGYQYERQGFNVEYFGATEGVEDHGIDLIAKKNADVCIIQCKYWSQNKTIHENHICQLMGTTLKYELDHPEVNSIKSVFITTTICSGMAKSFGEILDVEIKEKILHSYDYPMIKCNVGVNELGGSTKIYHLPIDQLYDRVKIVNPGEFYAKTVKEAEDAGFRRAWRWHGN